jgi:peptide/nickel transport system substrate-binding protein
MSAPHQKENLERRFREGKLTRREFIAGMAALGLTAVSPMLSPKAAQAVVPKKGGRFRVGYNLGHTDDTFDPGIMKDQATYFPSMNLRNLLVEVDHKGNALPELAESWEVSDDLKTWIFNLRRGVEFHNGKSFEAEDVIYSMNHHRGETKSAAKSLLDPVTDIKADGKHRVIFTLEDGNIDFQYVLTDYHFPMAPAGTEGRQWDKCIGTGAFRLKSWEPGVRLFAERNPNYWKEGRGHFDELEILVIKDTSSRTNALKTGMVDYMNDVDVKTVNLLKRDQKLQIITVASGFHFTMPMRQDTSPYDNNDVRLAMKHGIDREQIVRNVLKGFGEPGNDHPIGPMFRFHAREIPQRTYDPDKARYHIKKAGLSEQTFELSAMPASGLGDTAILFKEHAAKAGIDIKVVNKPADGYWSDVWMKDPFVMSFWYQRPTEDSIFTSCWSQESNWNESYWKHEKFNKLLVEARKERDEGKRRDMYVEMQRICRDEGPAVVPLFRNYVMAATQKIRHEIVAGNFPDDGYRAPERWWFES